MDFPGLPEGGRVHFIGIGGSSMNGLARIMKNMGYGITGSDRDSSAVTDHLINEGIAVSIGHDPGNITSDSRHTGLPDLIVYTAAVSKDNPELQKGRELGIPVVERSAFLGMISDMHKTSIAIAGTHGKTTTTGMTSVIMIEAGFDPTVHLGGELDAIKGGARTGGRKYFVTEACEYVDSFLKLHPDIAVILNVEADHLDYFKDIEQIKKSFTRFALQVKAGGTVIVCSDDLNALSAAANCGHRIVTYGLAAAAPQLPPGQWWTASNITFDGDGNASYNIILNGRDEGLVKLRVPGLHNISNSLAAAAACHAAGCSITQIKNGLMSYSGVHRRFEYKGSINGAKIYIDYAHHPSEIKATLAAARRLSPGDIRCVFQPHTYTRTKALLDEFTTAFSDASLVLVADIYAAREADSGEVNSEMLASKIRNTGKKAVFLNNFTDIAGYLRKTSRPGDIIMILGAGDIIKVADILTS